MKHLTRLPRLTFILLALLFVTGCAFYTNARPASAEPAPAQHAIDVAAAQPVIAAALTHFPHWSANAEEDDPDENTWYVEFYQDQQQEAWLGDALVDLDNDAVIEYDAPIFLSPEQEAQQRAEVEALTLADDQVLALLGDPDAWEQYSEYDPYEAAWYVTFNHGLDAWMVRVEKDENDRWIIGPIQDPEAFSAEEKQRLDRDKAIELATESDAVWAVLDGVDDWSALASPLTDNQWGVSLLANEREIYYLRVDIEAWKIIEEGAVPAKATTYLPYHMHR